MAISIAYAIRLSRYVGVFDTPGDTVKAYFARPSTRPAYHRAEERRGAS